MTDLRAVLTGINGETLELDGDDVELLLLALDHESEDIELDLVDAADDERIGLEQLREEMDELRANVREILEP